MKNIKKFLIPVLGFVLLLFTACECIDNNYSTVKKRIFTVDLSVDSGEEWRESASLDRYFVLPTGTGARQLGNTVIVDKTVINLETTNQFQLPWQYEDCIFGENELEFICTTKEYGSIWNPFTERSISNRWVGSNIMKLTFTTPNGEGEFIRDTLSSTRSEFINEYRYRHTFYSGLYRNSNQSFYTAEIDQIREIITDSSGNEVRNFLFHGEGKLRKWENGTWSEDELNPFFRAQGSEWNFSSVYNSQGIPVAYNTGSDIFIRTSNGSYQMIGKGQHLRLFGEGTLLLYQNNYSELVVYDLEQEVGTPIGSVESLFAASVHPDGSMVYYIQDNALHIYNAEDDTHREVKSLLPYIREKEQRNRDADMYNIKLNYGSMFFVDNDPENIALFAEVREQFLYECQ